MTKCIGWDIGIKNLAYCIIDSNVPELETVTETNENNIDTFCFNNKKYNIVNWKDISLVSQIETNMEEAGEVSHINTNMKCSAIKEKLKKKETKKNAKIDNTVDNTVENTVETFIVCGKPAFYCKEEVTIETSGTIIYSGLCKAHCKKLQTETTESAESTDNTTTIRYPELTVKKCWDLECNSKPIKVLKAHIYKGYCKKHINDMLKEKNILLVIF